MSAYRLLLMSSRCVLDVHQHTTYMLADMLTKHRCWAQNHFQCFTIATSQIVLQSSSGKGHPWKCWGENSNRSCRAACTCALLSAVNSSFSIIKIPQDHMPASTPEDVMIMIVFSNIQGVQ